MTVAGRVFYGALIGALIALLIHPYSRPYLLTVFSTGDPFAVAEDTLPPPFPDPLPQPKDLGMVSLWVHAAAERHRSNQLTDEEFRRVTLLLKQAIEVDPDNAFWRQALAAFYQRFGMTAEARGSWIAAAKANYWNDYQNARLTVVREQVSHKQQSGWPWAYAYGLRSNAVAKLIEGTARQVTANTGIIDTPDLKVRYATLLNGDLMRAGAKSVAIGQSGANIVEIACHPPGLRSTGSHRKLLIARTEFYNTVDKNTEVGEGPRILRAYDEVDGWTALNEAGDPEAFTKQHALLSLGAVLAPSLLLVFAMIGTGIFLLGVGFARMGRKWNRLDWRMAAALGIVLGTVVFLLTFNWLAALAAAGCGLFSSASPKNPRKVRPESLGPLLDFALIMIGVFFCATLSAHLASRSVPVFAVLPVLDIPEELAGGLPLLQGLAILVLALLLLAAPFWAIAQRLPSLHVLSVMFRRLGWGMATLSLFLVVLVTPISVAYDRLLGDTMQKLVENEPLFHVIRNP